MRHEGSWRARIGRHGVGSNPGARHGFVLVVVLLVLAAMGVLVAALLRGASFQSDLAHHLSEKAVVHQAAVAAVHRALEEMMQGDPGIERSRALGNPYLVGAFDATTGSLTLTQDCQAGAHECLCRGLEGRCVDFYVETRLLRCSAAVGSSLERYVTLAHRVSATATGHSGNLSSVAVEVKGTYEGYCP